MLLVVKTHSSGVVYSDGEGEADVIEYPTAEVSSIRLHEASSWQPELRRRLKASGTAAARARRGRFIAKQ